MIDFKQVEALLEDYSIPLTEDQLNYLVENRIEFIKTANKDKISTAHDPEAEKFSSDKIVDTIATKIDPTTRKEHTQWLVNRYKAGDFKLSDAKDMKKLMGSYEKSKSFLENKNLNDMRSVSHLRDNLAPVKTRAEKKPTEDESSPDENMPVVFESDTAKGYKVPSRATSVKNYGPAGKLAKTNWCTAAEGSRNMFSGYAGGKYTIHLDNGHILQTHHQSNQLMDIQNRPADIDKDPRFAAHADTIRDFLKKTHELEGKPSSGVISKYVGNDPEDIQQAINEHKAAYQAVKEDTDEHKWSTERGFRRANMQLSELLSGNSRIPDHMFDQLKSMSHYSHSWGGDHVFKDNVDYTPLLARNALLKPHQVDHIASGYIKDPEAGVHDSESAFKSILEHPNMSSDTAHKVIGHILSDKVSPTLSDNLVHHFIVNGKNLTHEHLNRLATTPELKKYAVAHASPTSNLPHDFLQHAYDAGNYQDVAKRHEITPDMADKVADKGDVQSAYHLSLNTSVPKETVFKALDKVPYDQMKIQADKVLERPDFEPEDVSKLVHGIVGKKYNAYNGSWRHSNKLTRADIQHVLGHENVNEHIESYAYPITKNNRTRADDLDLMLKNPHINPDTAAHALVNSPVVKPKHIDAALNMAAGQIKRKIIGQLLDKEDSVHELVTPGHLHSILNQSADMHDKHRVIAHPNVQLSHFEAVKDNPKFHGVISSSKNAPPSILHSLATSPMDHVRLNVAENPNTLPETRKLLTTDQDPEIAKIAARKLK